MLWEKCWVHFYWTNFTAGFCNQVPYPSQKLTTVGWGIWHSDLLPGFSFPSEKHSLLDNFCQVLLMSPPYLSPAQTFTSRGVDEVVWGYKDRLEPLYLEKHQKSLALSMIGKAQAQSLPSLWYHPQDVPNLTLVLWPESLISQSYLPTWLHDDCVSLPRKASIFPQWPLATDHWPRYVTNHITILNSPLKNVI